MSRFQKATKRRARLRMALMGPSGSGKTWSALAIATRLAGNDGRVFLIDTERGSASKYADIFDFEVAELKTFSPRTYVDAIQEADAEGAAVIVIDSLTHAWTGKEGALDMVDQIAGKSDSGNTFTAWREVTPEHNALVDAMLDCRAHVIVTMRTKMAYVLEEGKNGKKVPRKVGLQPIQREGLEYEFDVVADLDVRNKLSVSKTRCSTLQGYQSRHQCAEIAGLLSDWLDDGAEPLPANQTQAGESESPAVARLRELLTNATPASLDEAMKAVVRANKTGQLKKAEYEAIVELGKARRAALKPASGPEVSAVQVPTPAAPPVAPAATPSAAETTPAPPSAAAPPPPPVPTPAAPTPQPETTTPAPPPVAAAPTPAAPVPPPAPSPPPSAPASSPKPVDIHSLEGPADLTLEQALDMHHPAAWSKKAVAMRNAHFHAKPSTLATKEAS